MNQFNSDFINANMNTKKPETDDTFKIIDQISQDENTKLLKSMLPYTTDKKSIFLMIKFFEIQNIIKNYNDALLTVETLSTQKEFGLMELFQIINPHLSEENKVMFNNLLLFMNVKDNFSKEAKEPTKAPPYYQNNFQNNNLNNNNNNNDFLKKMYEEIKRKEEMRNG